ncbi:MAG TPA: PIG-L family deacetylase [Gemmatimonadales bacterium]|jgi:LmbE family N-acetylglucosaminyl deacetylase|nr:PIG-L family deacetylase [Gemmatimonadales bacterium]
MKRAATALAALLLLAWPTILVAQVGAGTGGAARLAQEQRLAHNWRRVLMIGAHPDDEDTGLLTVLARGEGMATAYLSLTRGDGGQNLVGPELGPALGVLRTDELLAARHIDGGQQFFTRAYDFGFSKTSEESLRFWNRDSLLKDMVRVIRRFRPQVVISVFTGTPADGHGHHQVAGILTPEAYHAAGDPARFPELKTEEGLDPWQPAKLYRLARGGGGGATLSFDAGVIDPAVGLSLHQIAVESRSQHRSQNQGALETLGPSVTGVRLVERVPSITGNDDSLFAGIPVEAPPAPDAHAAEAALIRAGVVLDATTDDDEVAPGQVLPVTLTLWNTGRTPVTVRARVVAHVGFALDLGFAFASGGCGGGTTTSTVAPGQLYTCRATATVEPHALPTSPYYLAKPLDGAMFRWSGPSSWWGEPTAPPLSAQFVVTTADGVASQADREIVGRFLDPVIGEVRRPVLIVPTVSVAVQPDRFIWPRNERTHTFHVSLENLARDSSELAVGLRVPAGWNAGVAQHVTLTREEERAELAVPVTAPLNVKAGDYQFTAFAVRGADTLSTSIYRIRYPQIQNRNIASAATAGIVVADVTFPAVGTIGYVRGGGDRVPEALTDAGLSVKVLTGDALERGPLAGFKVMVIGPRAYEFDASLVRAQPRLMRWLHDGGTLLVQYQQTPYVRGGFAPAPLVIGQPTQNRVTDETAPVTFVAPNSQALRWPNVIGPADFDGWIQERGLDFPSSWDAVWAPILETHDAGDIDRQGGLLVAHVGTGIAIYTGLSFHRELPAAVPGAWRLFANLLGLGQAPPAAGHRE